MFGETSPATGQLSLSLEPTRRIYSVSELNGQIQALFEREFRAVWVTGEVSGCRQATSGHYYFNLKDGQSQLKCVLFRGNARLLKFRPQDGLAALVRGNVEVYEERGEYQLIVELLEPRGAGALQLAFEQLKKKLDAEGLFDAARKRPLPALPRKIGIVTSPTGAVIRDMLHVLERRFPGLHIRLFPALVQGDGSVEQVCRGVQHFSQGGWADVIIVARGGGSLSDLWTFNEEAVARTIAASAVPVISAVGHETDFTIADFVADLRAPTPSAAAEIVIRTRESVVDLVDAARARLIQGIRYKLILCSRESRQQGLERAATVIHRLLGRRTQQLDDADYRLRETERTFLATKDRELSALFQRLRTMDLRLRFARFREAATTAERSLVTLMRNAIYQRQRKFEPLEAHLSQLSPLRILARGYAIVETEGGQVLLDAEETGVGEVVRIRFGHGRAEATVTRTDSEAPPT
ncbi:MAG: exodeoxyribonuclease VII large subunit [Bryobacteraceae bacterium]